MVTPAVAKKHKEEMMQAEYLQGLGQAPNYIGNPEPPLTAESVFGHTPTPPPLAVEEVMDIDNAAFAQNNSPLPASLDHLPLPQYMIPDDDFQSDNVQSDDDPNDYPLPSEMYEEHAEDLSFEDEFRVFENIRYGLSPFWSSTSVGALIILHRGDPPRLRYCNLQGICVAHSFWAFQEHVLSDSRWAQCLCWGGFPFVPSTPYPC